MQKKRAGVKSHDAYIDSRVRNMLAGARSINIGAWSAILTGLDASGESSPRRHSRGGGGMEFTGVREYAAGDDTRRIDWNVTARYGRLHVKEFAEESSPDIYVIMDRSASTLFGSITSKRTTMEAIGASIIVSALRGNRAVGMGIFAESLEVFMPAKRGRRHVLGLVREMAVCMDQGPDAGDGDASTVKATAATGTRLGEAVLQFADAVGTGSKRRRKRSENGIVFVISDYVSGQFAASMQRLGASHAVVMISVYDVHEKRMPKIGYACLEDAETGRQITIDTSDKRFQDAYARAALEAAEATAAEARAGGAEHIEVAGGEQFDLVINRHAARAARIAKTARMTRSQQHHYNYNYNTQQQQLQSQQDNRGQEDAV